MVGEASVTRYRDEAFEPVQNYKALLKFANKDQNGISLISTTAFSQLSNYDTRSDDMTHRTRVQWVGGALRPFVSGELRVAALNESNPLLDDFLPEPMRYLRGTLTPGIAYRKGRFEIGTSAALAKTRYEDELDLPVTINTTWFAKLSHQIDDKTKVAAFARQFERDYWDTPFVSSVRLAGIEVTRALDDDFIIGVELAYAHSTLISGEESHGAVATLGVMRRFGGNRKNYGRE